MGGLVWKYFLRHNNYDSYIGEKEKNGIFLCDDLASVLSFSSKKDAILYAKNICKLSPKTYRVVKFSDKVLIK